MSKPNPYHPITPQHTQDNDVDILLVSAEGNPNAEAAAQVFFFMQT
jgi:hypothetical protein